MTGATIGPTNRSLSDTNFAMNGDDEDDEGMNGGGYSLDDRLLKEKREIVAKLERQNREIAKEIKRLRMRQSSNQYLDLYSATDSSDYMSASQAAAVAAAAAAAANSGSSSSSSALRYQQLLLQHQQQKSAAAASMAAANYSNIYATKSRETTPATVKKSIDPNLIAELRNLKVLIYCQFD